MRFEQGSFHYCCPLRQAFLDLIRASQKTIKTHLRGARGKPSLHRKGRGTNGENPPPDVEQTEQRWRGQGRFASGGRLQLFHYFYRFLPIFTDFSDFLPSFCLDFLGISYYFCMSFKVREGQRRLEKAREGRRRSEKVRES